MGKIMEDRGRDRGTRKGFMGGLINFIVVCVGVVFSENKRNSKLILLGTAKILPPLTPYPSTI